MAPFAGSAATLRVHGWRHGIDIGVDARPLPGPGEGRIQARSGPWKAR